MTRLNLMLGGPKELLPTDWQQAPGKWAGADRGTLYLLQHDIQPEFSVGDYDSMTDAERKQVAKQLTKMPVYPAEKDYTDTELLLTMALTEYDARDIVLYAATGGRIDHELSNLLLATEPSYTEFASRLHITDATNWIDFLGAGDHHVKKRAGYPYLGVVPLTGVANLTIVGAKYPLHNWSSERPFSWASNEFVDGQAVKVSFDAGIVAIVYSRDLRGQKTDN
ncbi:thiamine diphosphokinase [Lacticaseibacillus pabuli]|uniref:Thiamine diphosphokinase n=1 Tax=Lacticaseibacillus pabuli TaxID=3025672 RepID=A0ABY7WU47_9LACO|nr:thiamine diphosphokinase [Lacticaseibacillus sp. KACC 23028]WDF83684.1 thiamine diphosphokinase [Lacticaseibacillus sp. KACC 23028]